MTTGSTPGCDMKHASYCLVDDGDLDRMSSENFKNIYIYIYVYIYISYGCQPKNRGTPKMDGENSGKPYFLMDDLGGKNPLFLG